IGLLSPEKDVDGITPANMAKIFMQEADGFAPCTAEAAVALLKQSGISPAGKRAVVIGRSLVVGKPLSMLLLKENCTVTVCHSKSRDLPEICREADILAVAAGKAGLADERFVSPGTIVLDVGIHVDEDGNLCGDVAAERLSELDGMLTPVPGGVGSVTTFILAEHVTRAAEYFENRR
ncbi:MAG: bifunctional 5,10-methylenetetrahydrofolate dehydrogenase/5,10-methenyltetrahydrofolate cyclohydrolase, partial [Parasporobacterium sp.]|nr:bifunctional 5,10-methylenetetrahydrofolate dehydrogenase/5,10-methenyltetrahydrofolate cyclohydrolase [Parasporobacterium sp.]